MCEYFWFAAGRLNVLIDLLLLGAHAHEASSTIEDLKNMQRPLDNCLKCKKFVLKQAYQAMVQCSKVNGGFTFIARVNKAVSNKVEERKSSKKRSFGEVNGLPD